jgi:hypothetical protein
MQLALRDELENEPYPPLAGKSLQSRRVKQKDYDFRIISVPMLSASGF